MELWCRDRIDDALSLPIAVLTFCHTHAHAHIHAVYEIDILPGFGLEPEEIHCKCTLVVSYTDTYV